jgi:putative polyketide hydroxylase
MELLRSWGLEDDVRAGQLDISHVGAFATETLASPQGRELPVGIASFEQSAAASPTTAAAVPQDHLEPVLLEHLRRFPAAKVRFGTELVSFDQDTDGVTVVLRTLTSGREPVVRADWLVGADGAHSRVRDGCTGGPGSRGGNGWRTTPTPD